MLALSALALVAGGLSRGRQLLDHPDVRKGLLGPPLYVSPDQRKAFHNFTFRDDSVQQANDNVQGQLEARHWS